MSRSRYLEKTCSLPALLIAAGMLFTLSGCPVDSEQAGQPGQGMGAPGQGMGAPGQGGAPGASGGPGKAGGGPGGPGGGPGGGLDLSKAQPQFTQEALAATEHVTLSGTLAGEECKGKIRIDVLELGGAPTQGEEGKPPGPLTVANPDAMGEFSLIVPKGKNISVSALCDSDNDNKISPPGDFVAMAGAVGTTSADISGIELTFGGGMGRGGPPGGMGKPGMPGEEGQPGMPAPGGEGQPGMMPPPGGEGQPDLQGQAPPTPGMAPPPAAEGAINPAPETTTP